MKRIACLLILGALFSLRAPATAVADEGGLKINGDIRGRFEGFWYSEDANGAEKDGRRRTRYRLRLNGKATVNPHAAVAFRISTGGSDSRSGNQTLGDPIDFGSNSLDLRRAYLVLMPFENGKLPDDRGQWTIQLGRVPNPFIWKHGKDLMLWDGDINPGGASSTLEVKAGEKASVFLNGGAFAVSENSSGKDPYFAAVQGGLESRPSENLSAGIRGSWYYFGELDSLFVQRGVDGKGGATSAAGNIQDGLTGSVHGGSISVAETQVYVSVKGSVPVTAFGGYSSNMSAEASVASPAVGKENVAYNFGLQVGDKKKSVLAGGGYWFVEANAFPSQFIDSDLLDGVTNRKGFLGYLSRQLMKSTDFNVALFVSDAIETTSEFAKSVKASKRNRLQVDLVYKF